MARNFGVKNKWKREFLIEDLFEVQIFILQLGGHWPVDYTRILPASLAFLSKYINRVVYVLVTFLNGHMCVLFLIKFVTDLHASEPFMILANSVWSFVLHLFAGFASFYFQYYHDECKAMLTHINTKFRRRSARGKFWDVAGLAMWRVD